MAGRTGGLDTKQGGDKGDSLLGREKTDTMLRKRWVPSRVLGERLVNRRLSVSSGVSCTDIRPYIGQDRHSQTASNTTSGLTRNHTKGK